MRTFLRIALITMFLIVCYGNINAVEYKDLDSAKQAAKAGNKRILLEFYRESCEYCHQAEEESAKNPDIIEKMKTVVHLRLNAREGEGFELADKYSIGYTFPVYILCDQEGEIYYRWLGYTGATNFLTHFNNANRQTQTISQRIEKQENKPEYNNAIYLARFFEESLDYIAAAEYYRQAARLSPNKRDFKFNIFSNLANASWNDKLAFNDVIPMADSIVNDDSANPYDVVRMASNLTNLARKRGKLDMIKKYLEKGIHVAKNNRQNQSIGKYYPNLLADYALFISHDTSMAIKIRTSAYEKNWRRNPLIRYQFAKWCLDRKINLIQAEEYARSSVEAMKDGYYKARNYGTIAEICFLLGKYSAAEEMLQAAIQQDPENDYYWDKLKEYQDHEK